MGIERYFRHDWWTARELDRIERAMDVGRKSERAHRSDATRRIAELEADLMRVALIARSLADLCIAKGLITSDELSAQIAETDFADGVFDGALDPKLVQPGARRLAELKPLDPSPPPAPKLAKPIVRKKKRR